MLRKPTEKKVPKKYGNPQEELKKEAVTKSANRPLMAQPNSNNNNKPASYKRSPSIPLNNKIARVEKNVDNLANKNVSNAQLQALLIEEIKGIKTELKQIKHQIGIGKGPHPQQQQNYQPYQREEEEVQEEQHNQNIMNIGQGKLEEYETVPLVPVHQQVPPISQQNHQQHPHHSQPHSKQQLIIHKKQFIEMGKIQPYMKDFKMQSSKRAMPYYHGYHKKSSKPVIIKYCEETKSMDPVFNLYERLWKNIVKAKFICINKVYDLNQPLASNILVIEANKRSLEEILEQRVMTVPQILTYILRALQFFHQCGYLYRNTHPSHVMQSFENQITLIDLKNMKKFVDIKGKHISLRADPNEPLDEFVSNARIRNVPEGRKDDLQCLGYLALFILEGSLPWNFDNMIMMRSKLTLKQLYGNYSGLLEYMIEVSQMPTDETPNYNHLAQLLQNGF